MTGERIPARELPFPETERPIVAVRLTVEYQFLTKAASYQQVLHFSPGTIKRHIIAATGREAEVATKALIRHIDTALGVSERPEEDGT